MGEKNSLEEIRLLFNKMEEIEKDIKEKEGKYVDQKVHKLKVERIKIKDKIREKLKKEKKKMKKEEKEIEICVGVGMDQIFPQYQRIRIMKDLSEIEEMEKRLSPNSKRKGKETNKISLINYEGDCIWAKKNKEGDFMIYDQYGSMIEKVNVLEFQNWIDGIIPFVDSKGKSWFYTDHHSDAKPSSKSLFEFIKC